MGELLFSLTRKDFTVQTFKSGGPGGQHQNKTDSGVRIIHKESGARGESREERSQARNKKIAFRRLAASGKFKLWQARKVMDMELGKTVEERVIEMLEEKNLKVEVQGDGGKWVGFHE